MIGPYGFKAIDRQALKVLAVNLNPMKEILAANKAALIELASNYNREAPCNDTLRKLRGLRIAFLVACQLLVDMDTLLHRAIAVGNVLMFRSLLREALSNVVVS